MGKTKQTKEKKFDRNVEISAPILDPEIIKAIHTPPKGQRLDIRHGGFKALLADLNSQDSVDELMPITENHVPSYIGISCAVSGYSNYSSYVRKPTESNADTTTSKTKSTKTTSKLPNRSQTSSPIAFKEHQVKHITLDKSAFNSPDEERKKLTEELTASATERRLSPSPLPPAEDERHHGAYVGARYLPMPPPSKVVNKHIPLLGIDDDQDPDEHVSDEGHKVEQKIASLYGDEFVEDWRESMSHKSKKEHSNEDPSEEQQKATAVRGPKDLVSLRPTPKSPEPTPEPIIDVPTPNVKVLASVEKQFLNKLLTDENPPMPKSPSPIPTSPTLRSPVRFSAPPNEPVMHESEPNVPATSATSCQSIDHDPEQRFPSPPIAAAEVQSVSPGVLVAQNTQEEQLISLDNGSAATQNDTTESSLHNPGQHQASASRNDDTIIIEDETHNGDKPVSDGQQLQLEGEDIINLSNSPDEGEANNSGQVSPAPQPMSPDSGKNQSITEDLGLIGSHVAAMHSVEEEEHIEYEIRGKSPVDNQSSPVRMVQASYTESNSEPVSLDKNSVEGSPDEDQEPKALVDDNANLSQLIDINDSLVETENHNRAEGQSTPVKQTSNLEQILEETEVAEELANKLSQSLLDEGSNKDDSGAEPAQQLGGPPAEVAEKEVQEEAANVTSDNNNNGLYYLNLLEQEKSFMRSQIERTQCILDEQEAHLDEDTLGRLRSAIGKANLLINKKCNQFKELCERSIEKGENEQYAVLNDDLAGFWDMLSIQFMDVRKSFENL